MSIVIRPYSAEHVEAVIRFNRRLMAAGLVDWMQVDVEPEANWLPASNGRKLCNEIFLALEDNEVHGAYVLKHQDFWFRGSQVQSVACYHHPISEGIIDKAYARVGALMVRDALRRQPLLFALGMDGYDRPLPQMLKILGWRDYLVPFYFRVVRPFCFLRQMVALRQSAPKRFLMDFAAFSGVGWLAVKSVHSLRALGGGAKVALYHVVAEFGDWANEVWERARDSYSMTAVRNCDVLNTLFSSSQTHFTRLQVLHDGATIGWAVVAERGPKPRFGNMRVASVVDCFATPHNAMAVVRAATKALMTKGFDMIVTNQSNRNWGQAFERAGFLKGPSNFILATSPQLSALLSPFEACKTETHFTRADGDGLPRSF